MKMFCHAIVFATLAGIMLFSAGCKIPQTRHDDVAMDNVALQVMTRDGYIFPASATYQWGPKLFKINYRKGFSIADIDTRLVGAFESLMAKRNFRPTTGGPATYTVGYALSFHSPIEDAEINAAYGEEFAITFPSIGEGEQLVYNRGVLIVDMIDNASRTVVWRGAIMADIDVEVSDDIKDRRGDRVFRLLLARFPGWKD